MKHFLLIIALLFSITAWSQNIPKCTWLRADTNQKYTVNPANTRQVLAVYKNRLLSAQLDASKLNVGSTSYGNYTIRQFDSSGVVTDSTYITGKVSPIDVQADSAGNWYIMGTCYDTIQMAGGFIRTISGGTAQTTFIMRLNASGLGQQWFNFIGADYYSQSNNFFVKNSTVYMPVDSALHTTIYKIDAATGTRTAFTSQYNSGYVSSVTVDDNDNVYVAGSCAHVGATFAGAAPVLTSSYPVYVIRYRNTGAYHWSLFMNDITCTNRHLTLAGNNTIFYTGQVNDSLTIGGFHIPKPIVIGANILVASLDSTGAVNWVKQPKDSTVSRPVLDVRQAVIGPDTTLVIIPQVRLYTDWGNGFSSYVTPQTTTAVVAYKMDGTVKWVKNINADYVLSQKIVANKYALWISGNVRDSNTIALDTVAMPAAYLRYMPFIAKLSYPAKAPDTTTHIAAVQAGNSGFVIYPNPAAGSVHITTLYDAQKTATVRITDICGRVYYQGKPAVGDITIDITAYPRGMYFVELRTAHGTETKKLLLE